MTKPVTFQSGAELDANVNLKAFVRFAREQLTTFGKNLPFDDAVWEVTNHTVVTGNTTGRTTIFFRRLLSEDKGWSRRWGKSIPMREPFLSFAKAYVRYRQTFVPKQRPNVEISALAVLEHILAQSDIVPNPVRMGPDDFNRAARLIVDEYAPTTAYTITRELACISRFMVKHNLVIIRLPWNSFVRSPLPH